MSDKEINFLNYKTGDIIPVDKFSIKSEDSSRNGNFICYIDDIYKLSILVIARNPKYADGLIMPIAYINKDYKITNIHNAHNESYYNLSPIEKMECEDFIDKMIFYLKRTKFKKEDFISDTYNKIKLDKISEISSSVSIVTIFLLLCILGYVIFIK